MLYDGTDIEIQLNDVVTWYFDDSSEGILVELDKSGFKVKWEDMNDIIKYQLDSVAALKLVSSNEAC